MIVNLSARLRTFHTAFADSHMRALTEERQAAAAKAEPTRTNQKLLLWQKRSGRRGSLSSVTRKKKP
jgi:hypothetical protein